ncbi:hypothetical protein ACODNH_20185 (plasmid) [Haloarcula sp. NS06]|uniref:hypothetical protein n=1 Tax=Haloarcula sp. NS06 TaxID=3409688 RepID=UPI003DA72A5B
MVSKQTKTTLPFILVAVLLWYVSLGSVATWVSLAVLIGVGVVLPTVLTSYQRDATGQ